MNALVFAVLAACSRGGHDGGFEDGLAGWTADRAAAVEASPHAGKRCAGGDAPWSLTRDFETHKRTNYRVTAWLRGKAGASVALFASEKGPKDERRVAVWDAVPDEWTPVSAFVRAERSKLTLRFAATDGAAWIDDVALAEASPPVAMQVERDLGFDDEPSMCRAADGTYYVAWMSWREGADSLQAARFAAKPDGAFERLGGWQVDGGRGSSLHLEALSTASDVTELTYVVERNGAWRGRSFRLSPTGPQPSTDAEIAHGSPFPTARGEHYPFGAAVRGDSCVILANDRRGGNVVLTRAPTICRAPVDVWRDNQFALLYENVETPGYRVSYETAHHVVVAKLGGKKLLAPKNYMATSPLWDQARSPAAAFDDKGRLWIAYLKPRLPTAGWEVWLTGWTGRAWVPPIPVSSMKGMNRRPSLVLDGNRAVICFQADDLPVGWGDIDKTKDAKSGVYMTSIELPDVPAAPHELEPLVENPAPWEAAEIRRRFGDENPSKHETTVGGEKLTLLVGDLHSHSDTSVCERLMNPDADDVYAMQRDFQHLDFACLTDHGEDFNPYLWNRNAKLARANEVPGKFTTFLGEEWASSFQEAKHKTKEHPFGFYGHRVIVLGDLRFPRWWNPRDGTTPSALWADLRKSGVDFVTIPHQLADTGNVPVDWSFRDETAEPVAEIFQVRGSWEAPGCPRVAKRTTSDPSYFFQGALQQGVVVGAIAAPDHGGGVGKACVWATENSRKAILDALRARRCYGTTGARIALEVRVAGRFMGERTAEHAGTEPVVIDVVAKCPGEIAKISVCRNGEWITPDCDDGTRFTDPSPPAGPKWYYVRVEQKDGEMAWSSPVWLGAN